jgi:signal transduction histidine kinase
MEIEKKLLLVDDEEDIRDVLCISLMDMGYEVFSAVNGKEALEIFHRQTPPIVLTDIKMPVMDGIELLRRIKQENPETEVLMITGHGDMDLAIRSLKHEASDFLTKPINIDILEIALKRVADKILIRRKLIEYTHSLEALVREKAELQDHLSSLGLMIGSISHAMKGLLTGLDGGVYMVEAGFERKDQQQIQEGWQTVKSMVERIKKMVLEILFYAKDRRPQYETIDLQDFYEEVSGVVQAKMQERGIELVTERDAAAGSLEADRGALRSALVNILENAADACAQDERQPGHRVVFSLHAKSNTVRFRICDDGIGMDDETRAKIFDLFYSTKGRQGTGLGLFITRRIIQQHGGSLTVDSAPGKGSDFRVEVPRKAPATASHGLDSPTD